MTICEPEINVEDFMQDSYYDQVHQSIIWQSPSTFKERLYSASMAFDADMLKNNKYHNVMSNGILGCLSLFVGGIFSTNMPLLLIWAGCLSNAAISSVATNKKQYALYTLAKMCSFYGLSRFFPQEAFTCIAIPFVLPVWHMCMFSFIPFRASVKTIWNSWPMQQQRTLLAQAKKQ